MKVSFYEGNIRNTRKAQIIEIGEYINFVKYGKFKSVSDKIAAIEDPKKRAEQKAKLLPYITTSGVFSERSNAALLEHSGLISIDVDKVDDIQDTKRILCEDPHSFAVFKSVSGCGLCVFVRVTPKAENHKDHFRWLSQYYYDQYGLVIDASCKDISRARFVSNDPEIYVNPKAKLAGKKAEQKRKPKKINWIASEDQMHRIVSEIYNNGIDITDDYHKWVNVAFAIADGYGEGGRQYFHAVSSMSGKYNEKQADKQYDNALSTRRDVTVGTFFYYAKEAGISLRTKEEEAAFAIAKAAKKNKSDIKGAVQTAEASGVNPKMVEDIAKKVFERHDLELNDEDISIIEELTAFIDMNTSLKRNDITKGVEHKGVLLDDVFINSLYLKSRVSLSDKVKKADVEAIIGSDHVKNYHPIKDWIKEHRDLPDQPEIIDEFINTINYKEPKAKLFVRHWLMGMPAQILGGEVVRLVLCLLGGQETGKTYFLRHFLPEGLRKYFAESNLMKEGDDAMIMGGNIVVSDDELGGKSKKDAAKFKELTSKFEFKLRLPYGKSIVTIPRLAMLCGTTNDHQIISDTTGNTRMLPVEFLGKYNFEAYNNIDKDQLFIEIIRAYERGETWKLCDEAVELLQGFNEDYALADFEGELVDKFFKIPATSANIKSMTATEIRIYIEQQSGQRTINSRKLGISLKDRFVKKRKKINGKTHQIYEVDFTNGF